LGLKVEDGRFHPLRFDGAQEDAKGRAAGRRIFARAILANAQGAALRLGEPAGQRLQIAVPPRGAAEMGAGDQR